MESIFIGVIFIILEIVFFAFVFTWQNMKFMRKDLERKIENLEYKINKK
jgi:hypothetical protein